MTSIPTWLWIASAVAGLIGAIVMTWALRGDRARGRRRCPKCWYSMQGALSVRCPECGNEVAAERELFKPRRRWRIAVLSGLPTALIAIGFLGAHGYRQRWHFAFLPTYKTTSSESRFNAAVEFLEIRDEQSQNWHRLVRVKANDRTVLELNGFYFSHEWWPTAASFSASPPANSLLIITEDSGGTGCYATQHVLAFQNDSLKPIAILPWCGNFKDVDGDGAPEFLARDRTFAYWMTSGADSPYPRVIFRLSEDGFDLAPDLMREPLPSDEALVQRLSAYRNAGEDWHSKFAALFEVTLDLIYAGHEQRAMSFLEEHWPHGSDGLSSDEFARELTTQLRQSPFWPTIHALNHAPQAEAAPSATAIAKPDSP